MYLVQDLVLARYIGSICMEIDVDQLYQLLKINGYDKTFILNADGQAIIPASRTVTLPSLDALLGELQSSSGDTEHLKIGSDIWYISKCPVLGLSLLHKHHREAAGVIWSILPRLLTGSILFLLLGTLGAFLITKKIYDPINQLVTLVLNHRSDDIQSDENELAYLRLSFFNTIQETDQMKRSMSFFAEDIQEQVIRKILEGYSPQEAGIPELEAQWKKCWSDAGPYQVIACSIQRVSVDPSGNEIDPHLCYQSIREIVRQHADSAEKVVILMEQDTLAIVLAGCRQSAHDMTALVLEIEKYIEDIYSSNALFRLQIAHGRACRSLEDISYSWQDGKQQVRYSTYLEDSDEASEAQESDSLDQRKFYQDRAGQIFECVVRNQPQEAEKHLSHILDDLFTRYEDDLTLRKYYDILWDSFLERCLSVAGWENPENRKSIDLTGDRPQWKTAMTANIQQLIDQLLVITQRKSYRYVELAVRYITENYTDSNLSSQMVAEYLHLTANYFSEIFNEHMKETFSSCLNRIRVENAQTLLLATDITIRDIGFKCGFTTIQHFNRMFKKYSGVSPKQYREIHMNGEKDNV